MDSALVVTLGAVAAAVTVVAGALLVVLLASGRRRQRELDGSRAAVAALTARLDDLTEALSTRQIAAPREYVITDAVPAGPPAQPSPVSSRAVLSVSVGEPLVRLVALGYGVRRALSAENRNRIRFEMRREVKRARRRRRRMAGYAAGSRG